MIAILLAVYNGDKYLKEQIESIVSQMDRIQEKCTLYVHDDGSRDGSREILREYESAWPDRVKLLHGAPQGGSTKNFMYMLREAEAEYYMFSDQDDVWLPNKIEREYEEIRKLERRIKGNQIGQSNTLSGQKGSDGVGVREDCAPGGRVDGGGAELPVIVFSDMKVVDEKLQVIKESFYDYSNLNPYRTKLNELILENVVSGCCMMFNRRLRDLALRYSDLNSIKWHDWWITEIAAAVSETIVYIPEPLMLYRQHGDNAVGATEDVNFGRIRKKLSMILSGEQSRETRKYIREAVDQGKQLMALKDDISEDSYNIIKALDDFDSRGKLKRIQSFRRLKLSRDKRNLWMMLHL